MSGGEGQQALREKILLHLQEALAIADVMGDRMTGYLIERALDQARADTGPTDLDAPPSIAVFIIGGCCSSASCSAALGRSESSATKESST